MTYNQAYNKIIEAYFKDEIEPYDATHCFCGTLCGSSGWQYGCGGLFYSSIEYLHMESALLTHIRNELSPNSDIYITRTYMGDMVNEREKIKENPQYENVLFDAMCAALDILKKIHISRGETINEGLELTKRIKFESCDN